MGVCKNVFGNKNLRDMRHEIDTCNQKVEDVTVEYEYSQQKLQSTEQALRDVRNKKHYWRKAEISFKTFKAKYASLEDECSKLQVNSIDQSLLISELETDANNFDCDICPCVVRLMDGHIHVILESFITPY